MKNLSVISIWSLVFVVLMMSIPAESQAQRNKRDRMERSPAQTLIFDNHIYLPSIKTVQWHPSNAESAFPIMDLGETDALQLSFDDLRGDIRNFYFSIEHCDTEWNPSGLSALEYAEGYNEDRILDYRSSSGTLQPYTHYRLTFPSAQVKPKIAGNYLLKVYEDADKKRLILTRRLYVLQPSFQIAATVIPSYQNLLRAQNQKIDLTIQTGSAVNDPLRDVKIMVMQNQRPDVYEWLRQPSFFNMQELQYKDQRTLDFPGGGEFRTLDMRSFRLASGLIDQIGTDSLTWIRLYTDQYRSGQSYGSFIDDNGAFHIRNTDRSGPDLDPHLAGTEADYAWVAFSLAANHDGNPVGERYVVGGFNQYHLGDENRMQYNPANNRWELRLLLKQGVYDYQYLATDAQNRPIVHAVEGSHFQTGNDYYILTYYRRPGTTWDTLAGYRMISN